MPIKIQPNQINIPKDNPFKEDRLNRKEPVEIMTQMLSSAQTPGVFGINSPWGNGKTTFLRMLAQQMKNEEVNVVEFNAWASDYSNDPFGALVSEMIERLQSISSSGQTELQGRIEKLRSFAEKNLRIRYDKVVRRSIEEVPVLGKAGGEVFDAVVNSKSDGRLESFAAEKEAVFQFKTQLSCVANSGKEPNLNTPLVVMIDELDRCKPTFAVDLLEVVKHIFDASGVIFVIAVNREELAHIIEGVYGPKFNGMDYLERFVDIWYELPKPDRSQFIQETVNSSPIASYTERAIDRTRVSEFETLRSMLVSFFKDSNISLRTIERTVHHLGLVYASLESNQLYLGYTTAVLMILKTINRELYYQFIAGEATDLEVVNQLRKQRFEPQTGEAELAVNAFDASLIVCQTERDGIGPHEKASTPLQGRYRSLQGNARSPKNKYSNGEPFRADAVLGLVNVILTNGSQYPGVLFKEAVARIELISDQFITRLEEPI